MTRAVAGTRAPKALAANRATGAEGGHPHRGARVPAWTHGANARLLELLDAVPAGVYRFRRFGNGSEAFVYANDALRRLLDLPWSRRPPRLEEMLERILPEDIPAFLEARMSAHASRSPLRHEFRVRHRNQDIRHLLLHSDPIGRDSGQTWNGVIADVTELRRTERELSRTRDAFRLIADEIPGAVFQYVLYPDGHDRVSYMSAGCLALWEIPPEQVAASATVLWEMVDPEFLEPMARSVTESRRNLTRWAYEWRITTPSGRRKWLSAAGMPTRELDGSTSWNTMVLDVTDRKEAEDQAQESNARYRLLAAQSRDLVCLHDANGAFSYVSPSLHELLGIPWQELLGRPIEDIAEAEYAPRLRTAFERALAGEGPVSVTFRARHASGERRWLELIANPVEGEGVGKGVQSTSRDVTERVSVEERLRHAALHDSLTGLPNRDQLTQRIEAALTGIRRGWLASVGLLFVDIGRFRLVNDSLGHVVGDDLLVAAARRLTAVVGDEALVGRLNGPEFLVLFERGAGLEQVRAVADRIADSFEEPFPVAGRYLSLRAHVGIAWREDADAGCDELLRDASMAARSGPRHSRSSVALFDQTLHEQALQRIHLEQELRTALREQQFQVHFQPIVSLATGALYGLEALVRWPHPERGLVPPDVFIPVAEESGHIVALDAWVLRESLRQLGEWRREGIVPPELRMSVNLSVPDLEWPGLVESVEAALRDAGVPGHCLSLELTERMLVSDVERTVEVLGRLRALGVGISVDDFGTGFSSLGYLHRLPVDTLKVDRSFVAKLDSVEADFQLVDTIVTLATRLRLHCIAEGVETEAQAKYLHALGCSHAQGWLYGRPLPGRESLEGFGIGVGC